MPIVDGPKSSTSRDREILDLANKILKQCNGRTGDIVLGALAQAFLGFLGHLQKHPNIPPPPMVFQVAADALTSVCESVRELPDETVQ